jgi:DNA replication protein DnaC
MSAAAKLNADGRLGLMLTELRLPTIKRLAAEVCDQSDREGWPARKLLEWLLEQEMTEREVRRFERHRVASGLSSDKRLSSFDFSAIPTISKARIVALAEGHEWLDRGVNLLAFGAPGSGKSHLLSGIGHALIDAGRRVLFTRCSDLVQRLQAARRDLRLPQELAKLDRFDLLILDDLSYVRRDQAETSVLFELIAERYERKSLAITANTPFSQWGDVFVDPAMTLAAIDRLVHHATILEMNVEGYRRRTAQEKQTGQPRVEKNKPAPAVDSVDEFHKPDVTTRKGLIHPAHSTAATTFSEKNDDKKEGTPPSSESPDRILPPAPKRPR